MRGNSWLAAKQLAAQEGLCTMEYVSKRWEYNTKIRYLAAIFIQQQ